MREATNNSLRETNNSRSDDSRLFEYFSNKSLNVRKLIESKRQGDYIEFGYEPRLLESILLATYIDLYSNDSHSNNFRSKLQEIKNQTFNSNIPDYWDLHLQGLLLELYYMKDSYKVIDWFNRYKEVLDKLFEAYDSDFKKYHRKLLSFVLIAFFCTSNIQIKNILKENLSKMTKNFNISREQIVATDVWRRVYYYLFYLWKNIDKTDIAEVLEELFFLQHKDNGTWNNNNLLTLLVVHVVRFLKLDKTHHVIIAEKIKKAEKYLYQHEEGITVLDSQGIYNSVLFYSFRYYYGKQLPPQDFIKYLIKIQNHDGGWSFLPEMDLSDVDTTSFAILCLFPYYYIKNSEILDFFEIKKSIQKGLGFISQVTNKGCYGLYSFSDESLPEMIARVIMVYSLLPHEFLSKKNRKKRISMALRSLDTFMQSDGSFSYYAYSFSPLYCISQVTLAIHFIEQFQKSILDNNDMNIINKIKNKILDYLENNKNDNGSFSSVGKEFPSGEQQSTCYAIISLALLKKFSIGHIESLYWLENVLKTNDVRSYPEGTGPRPIRYNDRSHGYIFVYIAILISINEIIPIDRIQNNLITYQKHIE